MYKQYLRKAAALVVASAAAIAFNAVPAKAAQGVIVAGTTNDGSKLYYDPSSVEVNNYTRTFKYAVIKPNGEIRINYAQTPWCRFGKIELDARALHENSLLELPKNPGWVIFQDNDPDHEIFIKADSPASINLLKAICAK